MKTSIKDNSLILLTLTMRGELLELRLRAASLDHSLTALQMTSTARALLAMLRKLTRKDDALSVSRSIDLDVRPCKGRF